MRLGGLQKLSLSDYPGRLAAVLFTRGCNYRCPFCHNPQLVRGPCAEVDEEAVLGFLARRRGQLDGVVLGGGEPTLQPDLASWLERVANLGYAVKLDTNGSRPEMLATLLEAGLVERVALDLKAPPARYPNLVGREVDPAPVLESLRLLARAGVPHEVRTTVVPALLDEEDLGIMARLLPAGTPWVLQPFVNQGQILEPSLTAGDMDLGALANRLRGAAKPALQVGVRGDRGVGSSLVNQGISRASFSSRA